MDTLTLLGQTPGPSLQPGENETTILFTILAFVFLASLVIYTIIAFSLSRIFRKTKIKTWKAWVPIYQLWTLLELGGQKGYWAIVAMIPVVNVIAAVFMSLAMYQIGRNFGKSTEFVLVAIFLPLVWYIWLATDKSTWHNKHAKA